MSPIPAYKSLFEKLIFCGNHYEYYHYAMPYHVDIERKKPIKRRGKKDITEDVPKRDDNLNRARQNVRRIIHTNLTPHTKFLTLTCAETVLDVPVFRRKLTTFFQAMKRQGYSLRYLYVLERQKERGLKEGNEGCIHAHIVVFNDEFIPLYCILKAWKHGSVDFHMLDGLRTGNGEKVQDVASYVCKYISKEAASEFGMRCYNCSKGLDRPVVCNGYCYGNKEIGYNLFADDFTYADLIRPYTPTFKGKHTYKFNLADGTEVNNTIFYEQGLIR